MHSKRKNYVVFTLRPVYTVSYDMKYGNGLYGGHSIDKWVPTYMTRDSFVHWLSRRYDEVVTNLSKDMSEVKREYNCDNEEYNCKYYLVKISKESVKKINPKDFEKDVLVIKEKRARKLDRKRKERSYSQIKNDYTFRRGPVPYVRSYRGGNGWYRSPQLQQARVKNEIIEYKEFVNNKYRAVNLPVWDDRPRHKDRSWKTSCKVKKQWMKHLDKHMDVMYI